MENVIRLILRRHSSIGIEAETLQADADLFDSGLSSHASVRVMMAIEAATGVEFPDEMLKNETFWTIEALTKAVEILRNRALNTAAVIRMRAEHML